MRIVFFLALSMALALTAMPGSALAQSKSGPNFKALVKLQQPKQAEQPANGTDAQQSKQDEAMQKVIDTKILRQKESVGYRPDLHGYKRFGVLICEKGYIKKDDTCVELPIVEGGEWYGPKLYCLDGYVKLEMINGDQDCYKLPEVENAKYRGATLRCIENYAPVGYECKHSDEIESPDEITWTLPYCPLKEDGLGIFREEGGKCIQTSTSGTVELGYSANEVKSAPPPPKLDLSPYQ